MRSKSTLIAFLILIIAVLAACDDKGEKLKNLVIESSSVEIGTTQNPHDGLLHFLVQIHDSGLEPDQEYNVRFIIQDSYIGELIESEKLDIPEIYTTTSEESAILTESAVEMKKEFTFDELKKSIKKDQAVIVELYDEERVITQSAITTFVDNRGKPLVAINSEAKIEQIDLEDTNEIAIFSTAVSDSTMEPGISTIVYPKYIFSLGEESYFLWMTEDDGHIMNTKDTYTIYSLSNTSFNEVKEIVNKD